MRLVFLFFFSFLSCVLVCLKVFQEHLVLCLDDDDDNFEESLSGESALCLSLSATSGIDAE